MAQSMLRYQAARIALLVLNPSGEWKERLKELNDADVHGPGKDDGSFLELSREGLGIGKGRYEMSWIWLAPKNPTEVSTNGSEEVLDEGMRVEWAKSQARANRWNEEVHLILEEMRRAIAYYEWKQSWWLAQGQKSSEGGDRYVQHGLIAYAQKQAHICKCMAGGFAKSWLSFLEGKGMACEWKNKYQGLIQGGLVEGTGGERSGNDSEEDGEQEKERGIVENSRAKNTFEWDD